MWELSIILSDVKDKTCVPFHLILFPHFVRKMQPLFSCVLRNSKDACCLPTKWERKGEAGWIKSLATEWVQENQKFVGTYRRKIVQKSLNPLAIKVIDYIGYHLCCFGRSSDCFSKRKYIVYIYIYIYIRDHFKRLSESGKHKIYWSTLCLMHVLLHKPYNIFSVIINLLHNSSNFPLNRKLNPQILWICELGDPPLILPFSLLTITHIPLMETVPEAKNSSFGW